jgi:KDO2-lipid IV(A) lauroyltransferase
MSRSLINLSVLGGLKLGWMVSFLPLGGQRWLGRLLGDALFYLAKPRRLVVEQNLNLCFPEMTRANRRLLERQFFRNVGIAFIDLFWLWRVDRSTLIRRITIRDINIFLEAKRAGPKKKQPIIIFAPHFLGLDAGGARLQLEDRLVCIYSKQTVEAIDKWIYRGRSRFNLPILVSRNEGISRLVRAIRDGITAHFSPDMDLGCQGAIFSNFFGVPAATQPSIIRLAHLTNAVIIPMVTRITQHGYQIQFFQPLEFPRDEPFQEGLQRLHHFLEQRILEAPDEYLWAHRRFKTRPSGEAAVYPPKQRR